MSKPISVLLIVLAATLGFAVGAITATRYWINPRQEFIKIEAEAFTNLVELSGLRKSGVESLIQTKERQLDTSIVALGSMVREGGKIGGEARQILKKVARYRSQVAYAPGPETQQWVNEALKLADQQP